MRSMMTLILLMVVVVVGFQYFKPKQQEPAPVAPQISQSQSAATQPDTATKGPEAPRQTASQLPAVTAVAETETTIEIEWY
jgi:hypothetical protein